MTRIATVMVVMLIIAFSYGRNAQAQERTLKSKYEFGTPELDAAQKLYSGKKYEEALAAFQSIIDKAQATNNWEELIYTMEKKAQSLRRLNNFPEAIKTMDEAIQLSLERLPKGHFLVSKIYFTRGVIEHRLRSFYNAREFLDTALVYYNNSSSYDSTLFYSMVEYKYYTYQYSEGSTDTLLTYLDKLKELEEIKQARSYNPDEILDILQGYSTIYIQKGDFEQALAYAIQGYKYAKENREGVSNRYFAEAQYHLAQVLYYKKDFRAAIEIGLGAMPIVESTPRSAMPEYYAFNNLLGISLMAVGDFVLALPYFEKAMTVINDKGRFVDERTALEFNALVMMNVGLCYENLGDREKGKEFLIESLERRKALISRPNPVFRSNYELLGDFYSNEANWGDALMSYDSALRNSLSLYKGGLFSFPDNAMEDTYSYADLRNFSKKASSLRLDALTKEESNEGLIAAQEYVKETHKLLMKRREDFVDSEGKLFLSENFKRLYETGIAASFELYSKTGRIDFFDNAVNFAKQSKAILFLEQSQEFDLVNNNALSQEIKERFYGSKSNLEALERGFYESIGNSVTSDSVISINEELLKARAKVHFIRDSIEFILSGFKESEFSFDRLLGERQTELKKGHLLIEFFYGEDDIYVLGQSATSVSFQKVIRDSIFQVALMGLVELVSHPPNAENIESQFRSFRQNSNFLYNALIEPILKDLGPGLKHLIIVPDEFLSRLPFEILVTDDGSAAYGFNDLNYLVKSFSVQYELSRELVNVRTKEKNAKKQLLGVGFKQDDSSQRRSGYSTLSGTERELGFLQSTIKGEYLIGATGSKESFLAQANEFDILHLAIHGRADSISRYESSLIFNGEENNVLNTNDLYLAGLNARLAVLSACESGVGVVNKGEGTFSIARGFSLVGVPSIVMSLWKVNDQITSTLMVEMYKNFINEGYPINESLRSAKLNYLDGADSYSAHPYYWAAFLQLGHNTSLKDETGNNRISIILLGSVLILLVIGAAFMKKRKRAK